MKQLKVLLELSLYSKCGEPEQKRKASHKARQGTRKGSGRE